MTDPSFNLLQLERHPNWYDHLPQVEAAMAAQAQTDAARRHAGWTLDEGGWYTPCGTPESDWDGPLPEDIPAPCVIST
jgi:hypothetical protein